MKPAPFAYHDPTDLETALGMLAELGDGARVLAGGQSLMPMLNMRVARPEHLIDLRRIPGLTGIELSGEALVIGAMTTHRMVETSPLVRSTIPLLSEAVRHVGHIPIRERGTLGGSLSLADPTAEMPLVSVVLGAKLAISSVRGNRVLPASAFFRAAMQTALADDEILTSVSFPVPGPGTGSAFLEFSSRDGDFATVGAAVVVSVDQGRYTSARIGLCGISDRPLSLEGSERLVGEAADDTAAARVADAIADELQPAGDRRATAQDRRDIARTLMKRALRIATARATAGMPTGEGATR